MNTMLDILKQGVRITWSDGWYLEGDPSTQYIEVGWEDEPQGVWTMNEAGLENSLADIEEMRNEQH